MEVTLRVSGLRDRRVVLHFDDLGPRTPHLPRRRFGAVTQLTMSAALHGTLAIIVTLITIGSRQPSDVDRRGRTAEQKSMCGMSCFLRPRSRKPQVVGEAVAIINRVRSFARMAWGRM